MAIHTKRIKNSNGISYTKEVDGSSNCDEINMIGVAQSGNTFYDRVSNVYAVSGFTFTNNRVFIDGNAVTATTSYDGVNFDKNSPDGHRWEYGIDNTGAFATSTKLQ